MLEKIKTEKWLSAHAVIGFWQANSNEKDSVTLINKNQNEELELQFLRLH
jgi:5-methyltetrahydrofolate--homocysteine methyltransferase